MAETQQQQTFNFCSGPAMLPSEVMATAQSEFLNFQKSGISVMEMSHRSPEFQSILESTEKRLRNLMQIPESYRVLFMQGGASLQFSAVPLNLASQHLRAGFLNTGYWSQKAMTEAAKYVDVIEVGSSEGSRFKSLPDVFDVDFNELDYLHITPNETIGGVECWPEFGEIACPIVADMSSCILSRSIDVSQFGVIYAGAQKNIGPAGLGIVIVKDELLVSSELDDDIPRLLNYRTVAKNDSMANTPPTYAIYLANLVFGWLQEQGGVAEIEQKNIKKAEMLYAAIDDSRLIYNDIDISLRSRMNVPFFFHDENLQSAFLEEAQNQGLLNLSGHRSQGGCRASIYNAMPIEGVQSLIEFMKKFENSHV